jgi:uncharacterized membrane protein
VMKTWIAMTPLLVFVAVTMLVRIVSARRRHRPDGRSELATMPGALSVGLAALFTLTGTSHFFGMREELERMVPPAMGNPAFWVVFTGVAEIAGAIGLLVPRVRTGAAMGLVLLLLAVFPANVHEITLDGGGWTSVARRAAEQLVYLAAVVWAGLGRRSVHVESAKLGSVE